MNDREEFIANMRRRHGVIQGVLDERERQDAKWGPLPRRHGNDRWNSVLTEETGEAAKEVMERDNEKLLVELFQVAAVAVAWIEELLMEREDVDALEATP